MRNLVSALLALLLIGCSTIQVRSTTAPNANLALSTFAFTAPVDPTTRTAQVDQSPAGQEIRNQLSRNLTSRGYQPAPPGVQPDFLVSYEMLMKERTAVTNWGGPLGWGGAWGWGWGGWWGGNDIYQYTEGTIVVNFVDPATQQVLWRGTATSVVDHPDNPSVGKTAKAVDKLMAKYPAVGLAASDRTRM
jgi:hypothetical protein